MVDCWIINSDAFIDRHLIDILITNHNIIWVGSNIWFLINRMVSGSYLILIDRMLGNSIIDCLNQTLNHRSVVLFACFCHRVVWTGAIVVNVTRSVSVVSKELLLGKCLVRHLVIVKLSCDFLEFLIGVSLQLVYNMSDSSLVQEFFCSFLFYGSVYSHSLALLFHGLFGILL